LISNIASLYIDKKQKHGSAFQLTFNENKSIQLQNQHSNRQVFSPQKMSEYYAKNIGAAVSITYRRSFL